MHIICLIAMAFRLKKQSKVIFVNMKLCKIYNQVLAMLFSIGILMREYIILIRIFMTRDICRPMVSN